MAGSDPHKFLIFSSHGLGRRLLVTALHIANKPLKRNIINPLSALALVIDPDLLAAGSMKQYILDLLGVIFVGRIQ